MTRPGGSAGVLARQARSHESPALEGDAAHLRADALTSAGVLFGLLLVEVTGVVCQVEVVQAREGRRGRGVGTIRPPPVDGQPSQRTVRPA